MNKKIALVIVLAVAVVALAKIGHKSSESVASDDFKALTSASWKSKTTTMLAGDGGGDGGGGSAGMGFSDPANDAAENNAQGTSASSDAGAGGGSAGGASDGGYNMQQRE